MLVLPSASFRRKQSSVCRRLPLPRGLCLTFLINKQTDKRKMPSFLNPPPPLPLFDHTDRYEEGRDPSTFSYRSRNFRGLMGAAGEAIWWQSAQPQHIQPFTNQKAGGGGTELSVSTSFPVLVAVENALLNHTSNCWLWSVVEYLLLEF